MKLSVQSIKHVLQQDTDIDPAAGWDVREVDALIFGCNKVAQDALASAIPNGFSDFERDHLKLLLDGQRYGHLTIRRLLEGDQSASAVDALPIARLQLEVLYSLCFMLHGGQNVRLFLKNGWKKYLGKTAKPWMDQLQVLSSVTEDERRTIEQDEIGNSPGPAFTRTRIDRFPSPMGVIEKCTVADQRQMLMRLYPEYQFLCSFAHGDTEATLFRIVSDGRSPLRNALPSAQIKDFYQREILETPIMYSAVAAVQAATEVAVLYPAHLELLVAVTKAWAALTRHSLLAVPIWEIRARNILPLV